MVEHHIAVVSTDFVAAYRMGSELMGIDPFYMKYVEFCDNAGMGNFYLENINVDGPNYRDHIIKYALHDSVEEQTAWIYRNFEK